MYIYDKKVQQGFENIKVQFVAEQSIVDKVLKSYYDWKAIRDDSIEYIRTGDIEKADLNLNTKDASQVILIEKSMDEVLNIAKSRADESYNNINTITRQETDMVILLLAIAMLLGIIVAFANIIVITRSINKVVQFAYAIGNGDLTSNINKDSIYCGCTSFSTHKGN